MDLKSLRIGYVPASPTLNAPADRRRFVRYARRRGLSFEIADPRKSYDLVVLTQRADLTVWSRYRPGQAKIVYDAIDSYLAAPLTDFKGLLRGTSKFVTRQTRYLDLNFRKSIERMCRRSDAIICSTDEQRDLIQPFGSNVHKILDIHDQDIAVRKRDYTAGDTFHLVWEGLASSGIPMAMMRDLMSAVAGKRNVALHIVTDLSYHKYHDLFVKRHTVDDAAKAFGDQVRRVFLYQWSDFAISRIATAADLALIPVDLNHSFQRGKPENKLLLFWRMGVPALASATPAYTRAFQLAGLDMACTTAADWADKLQRFMDDDSARAHAGRRGLEIAETHYSEAEMLSRWDAAFASL